MMQSHPERRPQRRVPLGPTGNQVRQNMRRLREQRGHSQAELSRRLSSTDRPLGNNAVNEIENGGRRVDVDDLMAIAYVLGVNPNALLMPPYSGPDADAAITGAGTVDSQRAWQWARGHTWLTNTYDDITDPDTAAAVFRGAIAPRQVPTRADRYERRRRWLAESIAQLETQLVGTAPATEPGFEWTAPIRDELALQRSLDPEDDEQWVSLPGDPAPPVAVNGGMQ